MQELMFRPSNRRDYSKMKNLKDIQLKGEKWLKEQGWKKEDLSTLIYKAKLEEEPYQPDGLYEIDGYKFLITFFAKDDFPLSKMVKSRVTGFDYFKYAYMQMFEMVLGIPAGVVFYNGNHKYFCFRQLKELPNPVVWRNDSIFTKEYHELLHNYPKMTDNEFREGLRHAYRRYKKNHTKIAQMVVWDAKYFTTNTNFQPTMI